MTYCQHSNPLGHCPKQAVAQLPNRCPSCGDSVDLVCADHLDFWLDERAEPVTCNKCGAQVRLGEPVGL